MASAAPVEALASSLPQSRALNFPAAASSSTWAGGRCADSAVDEKSLSCSSWEYSEQITHALAENPNHKTKIYESSELELQIVHLSTKRVPKNLKKFTEPSQTVVSSIGQTKNYYKNGRHFLKPRKESRLNEDFFFFNDNWRKRNN